MEGIKIKHKRTKEREKGAETENQFRFLTRVMHSVFQTVFRVMVIKSAMIAIMSLKQPHFYKQPQKQNTFYNHLPREKKKNSLVSICEK